jgi:hypothetical protein
MIESAASRIVQSPIVKGVLGLINRVPFPFHRFPVTVYGHRMVARTVDRFLALWLWKYRVFGAAEVGLLGTLCREGMSVWFRRKRGFSYPPLRGPWAGVMGFQADPGNFATLCRNLELIHGDHGCAGGSRNCDREDPVPLFLPLRSPDLPTKDGRRFLWRWFPSTSSSQASGSTSSNGSGVGDGAPGNEDHRSNPDLVISWSSGGRLRKSGFPPETVLSDLDGFGFPLPHRRRSGDVEKVGDRKTLLEAHGFRICQPPGGIGGRFAVG